MFGLMEQTKFFSCGTWIFWFWYTCQNKFRCSFIMRRFLNYRSFYIKQGFKILYNYCLSQLNLYTGWCTTIQGTGYLAKNLDKSLLMAQTKQKMIFWFFFDCSPASICYEEAGYQFFRKDRGCAIYRCHHWNKKPFLPKEIDMKA